MRVEEGDVRDPAVGQRSSILRWLRHGRIESAIPRLSPCIISNFAFLAAGGLERMNRESMTLHPEVRNQIAYTREIHYRFQDAAEEK